MRRVYARGMAKGRELERKCFVFCLLFVFALLVLDRVVAWLRSVDKLSVLKWPYSCRLPVYKRN